MLRLSTSKAAPGMTLALPVLHPEKPEHVLLKPGVRLEQEMIAALIELRVQTLWIDFPPTAYLLQYANPAIMAEHGRLAGRLGECFDRVRDGVHADLDYSTYSESIRSLIQRLVEDSAAAVFLQGLIDSRDPLPMHSANVCMLSLLMGLKLDGYLVAERSRINPRRAQNVEHLGLGALFHDIGMLRVDPTAAERWWRTFDESDVAWRRHTIVGFEMLRGRVPATAAGIALHHHQRMDGSGFPKRARPPAAARALSGGEIHVFSRIVAVADVFARGQAASGDRRPEPAVRGLRRVLGEVRGGKLDPTVFRALLAVVPAYSPGQMVDLSDGRTCVVTGWDPGHPCSPVVRPLLGADALTDERLLGAPIDLRQTTGLTIGRSEGESVANDNFFPVRRGEFAVQPTPESLAAGAGAALNDAA